MQKIEKQAPRQTNKQINKQTNSLARQQTKGRNEIRPDNYLLECISLELFLFLEDLQQNLSLSIG